MALHQPTGEIIDTTEDIIVMSDEDGYLDFPDLVNQLAAIDSDGLLYITRLTDQIENNHLVAATNQRTDCCSYCGWLRIYLYCKKEWTFICTG